MRQATKQFGDAAQPIAACCKLPNSNYLLCGMTSV
jgi:hypothetical protein